MLKKRMRTYLKIFDTHSDYETFTGSTDFILPNVSYCANEDEVHFKPIVIHEYVDLGLPSGALWATENIKDSNGNDLYFAWGETQGYTLEQVGIDKIFDWEHYKFGIYNSSGPTYGMTKYNLEEGSPNFLESVDDAATFIYGNDWSIPSYDNFAELINNCNVNIIPNSGALLTSKINENTIFFKFASIISGSTVINKPSDAIYWNNRHGTGGKNGLIASIGLYNFIGEFYLTGSQEDRCKGILVWPIKITVS